MNPTIDLWKYKSGNIFATRKERSNLKRSSGLWRAYCSNIAILPLSDITLMKSGFPRVYVLSTTLLILSMKTCLLRIIGANHRCAWKTLHLAGIFGDLSLRSRFPPTFLRESIRIDRDSCSAHNSFRRARTEFALRPRILPKNASNRAENENASGDARRFVELHRKHCRHGKTVALESRQFGNLRISQSFSRRPILLFGRRA